MENRVQEVEFWSDDRKIAGDGESDSPDESLVETVLGTLDVTQEVSLFFPVLEVVVIVRVLLEELLLLLQSDHLHGL